MSGKPSKERKPKSPYQQREMRRLLGDFTSDDADVTLWLIAADYAEENGQATIAKRWRDRAGNVKAVTAWLEDRGEWGSSQGEEYQEAYRKEFGGRTDVTWDEFDAFDARGRPLVIGIRQLRLAVTEEERYSRRQHLVVYVPGGDSEGDREVAHFDLRYPLARRAILKLIDFAFRNEGPNA